MQDRSNISRPLDDTSANETDMMSYLQTSRGYTMRSTDRPDDAQLK